MDHVLNIVRNSEAEKRLMELVSKIGPGYEVHCLLGEIFGWSYNTYRFPEDTFQAIRKLIKEEYGS